MATPKTWPEVAAQVASLHPDGAAVAALAEAAGLDPDDLGMIGMDVDGEHSLALVFGDPRTADATWVTVDGVIARPARMT